jgi:hypothetical protein
MRLFACILALLTSASAWAQTPPPPAPNPGPSPQTKATPQAQPPQVQLYRLVPVEPPAQPQYQTVQVQQPVYQTVQQPVYQTVQQPQYQTVQLAAQPVQQAVYTSGISTTLGIAPVGQRTVVLGPGLVSLSLARAGQTMVNVFGKSHVWQIQHTTVAPQIQPAPPVQLVSVSLPNPVVQQPVYVPLPQQVVQQPVNVINAPSEAAPPPPVIQQTPKATPQSSTVPPPRHSLFGMLGAN